MASPRSEYVEVDITTPREDINNANVIAILPDKKKEFKLFKVLVIGEPNVGKSSFIKRYIHNVFSSTRKKTLGLDFMEHTFQWDEQTEVRLHFWDVPGEQRLQNQPALFYRDTRALIVMYDASLPHTMSQARKWKQDADIHCTLDGSPYRPPAILLANKIDLVCEKSEEFDDYGLNLVVREEGFRCGFPISNLGGYNIAQTVRKLVELLLEEESNLNMFEKDETIIALIDGQKVEPEKKKCECL